MDSRQIEARVQEIQDMIRELETDLQACGEKANITITANAEAIMVVPSNGRMDISFWLGY
jgi:hypothetical protein